MKKIELVQKIGDEVCEMCGPDSDCDIAPPECSRIKEAINLLDDYTSQPGVEADACNCGSKKPSEIYMPVQGFICPDCKKHR